MGNKSQSEKPTRTQGNGAPKSSTSTNSFHPEKSSSLMNLPRELRDDIYSKFFNSIRFTSGDRVTGRFSHCTIVPAFQGSALALLRTCRQINAEIGQRWLREVLFAFESPEALLNKLCNIPNHVRGQIRHVRVSGDTLMINHYDDDALYRTAQVLKLLPGLNLDRLTVLGTAGPQLCYETLDMLIRHSDGWRELHFLSRNSEFLGYRNDMTYWCPADRTNNRYTRRPQPADWQEVIEKRDGPESKPSILIYRAIEESRPGAVLQSGKREIFSQPATNSPDTYGESEDIFLMQPGERNKEILVVVKRGKDVDYAERDGSPVLLFGDIREDCQTTVWATIKARQDARGRYPEEYLMEMYQEAEVVDDMDPNVVVDSYDSVDEYAWPAN